MADNFKSREYLGKGISFPLRMTPRGELKLSNGEQDIQEAIRIILSTRPGERVMRPEFGCRAHELLFEPRNASTEALMQQYVINALNRWEPRIEVISIEVFSNLEPDGALYVEITYEIKPTHDVRSIVYPFFLTDEEAF